MTIVECESGFIDIDAGNGRIVVFTTHVFTVLGSDLISMANLLLTYLAKYSS